MVNHHFSPPFGEYTGMSCWYLGSLDQKKTLKQVGCKNVPEVGEISQLTNDRYDHFQPDTLAAK